MLQEYVVIYATSPRRPGEFLLVEKDRPQNQKGRFNLIGGKVEPDETAVAAAERELVEETGLTPLSHPQLSGTLVGTWGSVTCWSVLVSHEEPHPREGETERVFWTTWGRVVNDPRLMPNLRVILPLVMSGVTGWAVNDEGDSRGRDRHSVLVTIPTR